MSGFLRTPNGLNNLNLFHSVDYIVYLEGGESLTKSDVYLGNFTEETDDVIFWSGIFRFILKAHSFKFKSIGSKATLMEICGDITNGNITSVLVAMDNEFDEILGHRIAHPKVFYTFGYSWENDVWNEKIITDVIFSMTGFPVKSDINKQYNQFLRQIKLAVYADGYLFKKEKSFFNRSNGRMFCIDCNPSYLPSVKTGKILDHLSNLNIKKSTVYSFGAKNRIEPQKFCYGHLLADFCYQLILHYITKTHKLSKIPKDIIFRLALHKFFERFTEQQVYSYYEKQLVMKQSSF